MQIMWSFPNIVFILTAVISAVLAIFLIVRRNNTPVIFLSIILLINGFLSLNIFLSDTGFLARNSSFLFLPINFLLALGPSLYFYTKLMISKSFKFRMVHFLAYLPVLIEFVYYLIIFTFSGEEKLVFEQQFHFPIISPIEQGIGIVYTLVFLVISLLQLIKYEHWVNDNYSNKEQITLNWLSRLLIIYSIIWVVWIIISIIDYFVYSWGLGNQFYYPIYILFLLFTILVTISAFKKKHSIIFIEISNIDIRKSKVDINILDSENLELIYKLRQLMEVDQLYLDSTLKMSVLAEQLNIPSHRLSNLLNSGLKKSFYEFINFYRVEHVKKMLLDVKNAKLTILAIAYDSGFNSKSTFNEIFKKVTKMTPKEFKKQALIIN